MVIALHSFSLKSFLYRFNILQSHNCVTFKWFFEVFYVLFIKKVSFHNALEGFYKLADEAFNANKIDFIVPLTW